ncbi:MAG: riboflavin kinase/FMN adenylyltransferase [Parasphingorhabdus sp.]|jgi:riboflavin kinase/FMN adenylyltransferase
MKTFFLNLRSTLTGHRHGVLAIGNFDGVHLGHQAVIHVARDAARKLNSHCAVLTFEPHPREFFQPDNAPPRLTGLRHKLALFKEAGVDVAHCLRFNRRLAETTAEEFIEKLLVNNLAVKHVIVGRDFQFGRNRTGNVQLLKQFGDKYGFVVTAIEDYLADEARISSSNIRELLKKGDLTSARKLLGRPVSHIGRVLHGDKRGRQWGFPTANFTMPRHSTPLSGVFAVRVDDGNGWQRQGVANVGRRPTVDGLKLLLEVHLFDVEENLYGKLLQVEFLSKVREEKKFADFEQLKKQISQDIDEVKRWMLVDAQAISD